MSSSLPDATRRLAEIPGLEVLLAVPLAQHTSFHIGGPADLLLVPSSEDALRAAQRLLSDLALPRLFLGRGTNVLAADQGVRAAVVKLAGGLVGVTASGPLLLAAAGEDLGAVCHLAAEEGLSGLEWAAGIPGTVGGAVLMNAGAHGGEMADVVSWVERISPAGEVERLSAADLDFGYRFSSLRGTDSAVSCVGLKLAPADRATVHSRVCAIIEARCAKQPVTERSAGSIFKRPQDDYAGRLVEAAEGKGLRVGDAAVSAKHANFIVNLGSARAADVMELIRHIRRQVRERFGVELETEVCLFGECGSP